jgi:hypothetical protein
MKALILLSLLFFACEPDIDPCTYGNTQYPKRPAPYDDVAYDDRVLVNFLYAKYIYDCYQYNQVEIVFERNSKDDCWPEPEINYDVCK